MASEETPPREISRVRELFSQAVEALGGPSERSSAASSAATGISSSSARPAVNLPRSAVPSALAERNLLFNFDRKWRNRKGGPGKSKKSRVSFWSHDFICMADNEQIKTPSGYERSQLMAAGSYYHREGTCMCVVVQCKFVKCL